MSTKFTSGEWYVYERGIDCGVGVGCSGIRICELSLLSDDVITKEENTANAYVMAQSKNMYAELVNSMRMLNAFHKNTGSLGARAQAEIIRVTLAKARGEL
jgi:hypothetical protein